MIKKIKYDSQFAVLTWMHLLKNKHGIELIDHNGIMPYTGLDAISFFPL